VRVFPSAASTNSPPTYIWPCLTVVAIPLLLGTGRFLPVRVAPSVSKPPASIPPARQSITLSLSPRPSSAARRKGSIPLVLRGQLTVPPVRSVRRRQQVAG